MYREVGWKMVREDVAYADRGDVPDGILCRDAKIGMLEEWITDLKAKGKSNVHR